MNTLYDETIELRNAADGILRTRWLRIGPTPVPGAGEAVLGLHMLGLHAESFAGVGEVLAAHGYPLYSYDQRGHRAAADQPPADFAQWVADAVAALDRVPAARVHVVGSSMGGAVAAELAAAARPGRVKTLSLIATPVRGEPVFAERARAEREGTLEAVIPATIARWFGDASDPSPAAKQSRAALRCMTPAGYDAAWRALAEFGGYDTLADRLPPTLCLAFTDDLSTPPTALDEIADTIRRTGESVRRADVADVGHAGLIGKPREIADELLAHFRSTC